MASYTATGTTSGPVTRLATLDAVRGAAVICMLIAHGMPFLWWSVIPAPVALVTDAINDVASPLFGLAMGAAAAMVWGRTRLGRQWPRRVLTDLGRGVVVFAIGMLLVEVGTWVAVVLQVLGVLMVIGIPVAALAGAVLRAVGPGAAARRRRLGWSLLVLTGVFFVAAPWVTGTFAPAHSRSPNGTTGGTAELWVALMAGHSYRAASLLPFFALGALMAAASLWHDPRRVALVTAPPAGILLAVSGYGFGEVLLSGDSSDQWRDLTFVLCAVVVVAAVGAFGGTPGRGVTRLLADLGAIALSLYALQIVMLKPMMMWTLWQGSLIWAWVFVVALVVVPSTAMILWRRALGPGPLERVVALVTGKRQAT